MSDVVLRSAWAFGPYRKSMGRPPLDHPRIQHAVLAIKRELTYLGADGIRLDTPTFGPVVEKVLKEFQVAAGLTPDGLAGQRTCNALWRARIATYEIPGDWLRAQLHWESGDDPAATFTNPDGSRDRGLCQLNSSVKPATDDEAYDPAYSVPFLAQFLRDGAAKYAGVAAPLDPWCLAVGRWRTPVGADEWAKHPWTKPLKDGTWAEKAAYYVSRVDVDGRKGWA